MASTYDRRTFLKCSAALATYAASPHVFAASPDTCFSPVPRKKEPGLVRGAFFYPPAEVVLQGKCEDTWSQHKWFTWPGNQFEPEQQQKTFCEQFGRISAPLDLRLAVDETPIYTDAGVEAFIKDIQTSKPEALLLINFWNSFSKKLSPILDAFPGPIILYHSLGSNHQLPPEKFRTAPRTFYIHSLENWDAIERGLRAVHAMVRMRQSKLLRVSGQVKEESDDREKHFGTSIHTVPAGHFNDLFDSTEVTREMKKLAGSVRRHAGKVMDLSEQAFLDAVRAHDAVRQLMAKHEADAITIECLFLQHRKPCLSFALNNGVLVPCGCENDLNASLTLMLGSSMFGRGGFQHNPEFDTVENLYFGAHCTCATRLHGPAKKDAPYDLRPFFHQMPKTLALDVQWPEGEPVTLCKYHANERRLDAWLGDVVSSPKCPPSGGCATRVLVKMRDVQDVCTIYPGPHPVLFCGDFASHLKTFARLYEYDIKTNC